MLYVLNYLQMVDPVQGLPFVHRNKYAADWNAIAQAGAAAANTIQSAIGGIKSRTFAKEQLWRQQDFQREVNATQMAYQDRVNQQNFDWNREKNVRSRIEEAGYNPYLYGRNADASGANVGSASNLGASASPVAPVEFSNPVMAGLQGADSFAKALTSLTGRRAAAYDQDRKEKINAVLDENSGVQGGTEAKKAISDADIASNNARQTSATAAAAELETKILSSQAMDESNQPVTDAEGHPVTVLQQRELGKNKELFRGIEKLCQDVRTAQSVEDLNKIERDLKKYNLDFTNPAQLDILRQTLTNLKAEFGKIVADTDAARASAVNSYAQASTAATQQEVNRKTVELIGQRRLTEVEQTRLKEVERFFSSTERLQKLYLALQPKDLFGVVRQGVYKVLHSLGFPNDDPDSFRVRVSRMSEVDFNAFVEEFESSSRKGLSKP